ncbi:hypothetical protein GCM10010435_65820 [Winogradskya consettensis]|uniref:ParB/Sulfiredoxin domain-containing protein n=1 Tax=Winogradskya consettensis TaxID=113560 RepID=A0A919T1V6_9ACTN|nr:hypothetical protein [Actinoplanes consettensis]GIM84810.1 hypothetical protein Aco04nite_93270 [Actinoplanes consettensis]
MSLPKFDDIPIERLRFDPENPRFPRSVNGANEVEVLSFMLADAGLLDLMGSIAAQGFFPGEPLLVYPHPGDIALNIVVEGNRRLAASKLLVNPSEAPIKAAAVGAEAEKATAVPTLLPCLIFESRQEILKHLGYRHVTGIREWDPLAKARFLRQRIEDVEGEDNREKFKELARTIGSRADYVGRLLAALRLYEIAEENAYFGIVGLSEETVDFSLISSVLAYSNIVAYLGLSSSQDVAAENLVINHLSDIVKWVFERVDGVTVLGESRNIKKLAEVVGNEESVAALRNGEALDNALSLASGDGHAFRQYVLLASRNLQSAAGSLEGHPVSEEDVAAIEEVRRLALDLRKAVQALLDEEE